MTIAEIVANTRQSHNLTMEQLATRLKCSRAYICMIESGSRIPSKAWVKRFARSFRLDEDELQLMCGRMTDKVVKIVRAISK